MHTSRLSACVFHIATQAENAEGACRIAYAAYVDKPSHKNVFAYGNSR